MHSAAAALVIERYVEKWLRDTELGRAVLENFAFDEAVDSVFELLNAGFLKIIGTPTGFTGIRVCVPPRPPKTPIHRNRRRLQ